jgi:hypothetical protein
MNPYFSIWFNTQKTIEEKLKSNWIDNYGAIPYLLFGINGSLIRGSDLQFIEHLLFLELSPVIHFFILIAFGVASGLMTRVVGVYTLYFFGKIWKGHASKTEIDTVLSLSLIPEILISLYLITIMIIQGDLQIVKENNILTLVVYIFCLRILVFGLSRVQQYSFGLSLLNIWLPYILVILLYLVLYGGY